MKIGILGTGSVGQTIGKKLISLGHEVKLGSRDPQNEKARTWAAENGSRASHGTHVEAASFGEILFNCTAGVGSMEALLSAGKDNLKNKILIDVANPLDFSNGFPPSLSICNTNSLAEEIQKAFPETKVVKSLNTMWAGLMVDPGMINGGNHSIFLAGNDAAAKEKVRDEILAAFGWKKENCIDLGDISKARGTEMYLPLWLSIYGATQNGAFNMLITR